MRNFNTDGCGIQNDKTPLELHEEGEKSNLSDGEPKYWWLYNTMTSVCYQ